MRVCVSPFIDGHTSKREFIIIFNHTFHCKRYRRKVENAISIFQFMRTIRLFCLFLFLFIYFLIKILANRQIQIHPVHKNKAIYRHDNLVVKIKPLILSDKRCITLNDHCILILLNWLHFADLHWIDALW